MPSHFPLRLSSYLLTACLFFPTALRGVPSKDKPLSNADVVSLAKADLGDEVVISKIQQAPKEALDVSTDALIALKKQGVSKPVLDAMIKRVSQRSSGGPSAGDQKAVPTSSAIAKPKPPTCKTRCCVDNYSKEGSFALGSTFKTFLDSATVQRSAAFERAAKAAAGLGWQITSASKDAGLISGATTIHTVIDGTAVQATLSISISDGDFEGVHVELTMFGPSGTKLLDKAVQKDFCKIFHEIQK